MKRRHLLHSVATLPLLSGGFAFLSTSAKAAKVGFTQPAGFCTADGKAQPPCKCPLAATLIGDVHVELASVVRQVIVVDAEIQMARHRRHE